MEVIPDIATKGTAEVMKKAMKPITVNGEVYDCLEILARDSEVFKDFLHERIKAWQSYWERDPSVKSKYPLNQIINHVIKTFGDVPKGRKWGGFLHYREKNYTKYLSEMKKRTTRVEAGGEMPEESTPNF